MKSNDNFLLSVIIPHYNSLDSLESLLNSIPNKKSVQVVVVDDHSSINLATIYDKFSWVDFLSQDEGKKWAGAARNKGLLQAKGKYILFADADDYFVDNAFDVIDKYISNDFDIVYFTPTSINDNGKSSLRHVKYSQLVSNYLDNNSDTIRYEFFVPWSKLYRAEFLSKNNIQFDEVIASNDVMFSLLSGYYAKKMTASKETIYCVVESSSSLTTVVSEDVVDSRFNVLCRYNDFIKNKLTPDRQVSVISCLSRARKINFFKMLSFLFYSIYKKYPILPRASGLSRWFKRVLS